MTGLGRTGGWHNQCWNGERGTGNEALWADGRVQGASMTGGGN